MTTDVHAFFILGNLLAGEKGCIRKFVSCLSRQIYTLLRPLQASLPLRCQFDLTDNLRQWNDPHFGRLPHARDRWVSVSTLYQSSCEMAEPSLTYGAGDI
jgi:hypothetical protein